MDEVGNNATRLLVGNGSSGGGYSLLTVDYEFFHQDWNATSNNGTGVRGPVYEWPVLDGEDWEYPSGYSRTGIILTSFFVTVIMILIVVGNMLVCIAIATEKSLKTVQNWFIASLAVSDFLVGLIVMPFSLAKEVMGYWIFGRFWCEMHSALDVFLCTASINSLCLISLDRYWSVTHAVEYLRKRTPRRSLAMICGVWVLSAIISLPPLVGWKKPEKPSDYPECLLSDDVGYVLYSAFGSFYVPAFVMVFVYCRIFVAARSRARRHLKQRQRAAAELTTTACDPTAKSTTTTTTTCTSFSNASPTRTEAAPPQQTQQLEKIPESNGDGPPPAGVVAPEIVIEESTPAPQKEEPAGGAKENGSSPKTERCKLFVSEATSQVRRPSLLRAPKFLKSPFGSTMSLADLGRSEEDVRDLEDKKGRKKKLQQQQQQEESASAKRPPQQASEAERQRRRIAKAKERRATLILGLIMASFILAWLPFFVLYVLEALCAACDIGPTGFAVAFWLGYCNSALNPIIYTIFNRDFRKAFRKILFK